MNDQDLLKLWIDRTQKDTFSLHKATKPIVNILVTLSGKRSKFEDAVTATYFRMFHWMGSLTRLSDTTDFQVVLHGARCMYELKLDLMDLFKEPSLVKKFFDFNLVSRFSAAKKLVNLLDEMGIADEDVNKIERKFINDTSKQTLYDSFLHANWNGKYPIRNWVNETLPDRAESHGVNELLRYRRIYSQLCWFSHSGTTGICGLDVNDFGRWYTRGHVISQELFYEATKIVGEHFEIFKANPELIKPINDFDRKSLEDLANHLMENVDEVMEYHQRSDADRS